VRRRQHRQPFQQYGAEPLAMEQIIDRERDLGARRIALEVRPGGNRPQLAVDLAQREQRRRLRRVRRFAERIEKGARRLGQAEKPAVQRFEREAMEELPQLVAIGRTGEAELHDRSIAQHRPIGDLLCSRQRRAQGTHVTPS